MELYHATNRGVDGKTLFQDTRDYVRFVHDLFEFNDIAPAGTYRQRILRDAATKFGRRTSELREKLVEIHGWCLMRNHYHLLLSEIVPGGIPLFLKKLNGGYAKYFNERQSRKGTLFQAKTRKVLICNEAHFLYVLHYIHLNPLDYLSGASQWRERDKGGITSVPQALAYLKEYRWSSYPDYCGIKNFPSILQTDLFKPLVADCRAVTREFLADREDRPVLISDNALELG